MSGSGWGLAFNSLTLFEYLTSALSGFAERKVDHHLEKFDLDIHQISISLLFSYRMASSSLILPGHAPLAIREEKHNTGRNMRAEESSHLKQD